MCCKVKVFNTYCILQNMWWPLIICHISDIHVYVKDGRNNDGTKWDSNLALWISSQVLYQLSYLTLVMESRFAPSLFLPSPIICILPQLDVELSVWIVNKVQYNFEYLHGYGDFFLSLIYTAYSITKKECSPLHICRQSYKEFISYTQLCIK